MYQLSWAETKWEEMYEGRNEIIVSSVVCFLLHELVFYSLCLAIHLCDYVPYFKKYKLQQESNLTVNKRGILMRPTDPERTLRPRVLEMLEDRAS